MSFDIENKSEKLLVIPFSLNSKPNVTSSIGKVSAF